MPSLYKTLWLLPRGKVSSHPIPSINHLCTLHCRRHPLVDLHLDPHQHLHPTYISVQLLLCSGRCFLRPDFNIILQPRLDSLRYLLILINIFTYSTMLSQIWVVSALCAVAFSAPTFSPGAAERPVEMKVLSDYFHMLGSKVQAGRQMAQAPVCNLANAVMPVACKLNPHFFYFIYTYISHSSNTTPRSISWSIIKTCSHWTRNTKLHLLNHQHDRRTRSHRSYRNPLQRNMCSINIPRPPRHAPQISPSIQPHRP